MGEEERISRRKFLKKAGASALLIAGGVTLSIPIVKGLTAKRVVKSKADSGNGNIVELGNLQDIQKGPYPMKITYKTMLKDGWVNTPTEGIVYVTKKQGSDDLLILSPVCTHLGCTVPFASDEAKKKIGKENLVFLCPCHGGQYDVQGVNIGGPPPRPLDVFQPIIRDGRVYINILRPSKRTSKTV